MKRISLLAAIFMMILQSVVFAGAAEDFLNRYKTVAVVIIGNSDFRSPDFYNISKEAFKDETGKLSMIVGDPIQTKYQEFWFDKGFLEEQTPNKDSLLDFTKYCNYDEVLFILVRDPTIEKNAQSNGIWGTIEHTRASIQINAFLCTPDGVKKLYSSAKEDDSRTSDLRAKRGAFEKCMKDIAKNMKSAI